MTLSDTPHTSAEQATGPAWDPVVLWSRPEEERQGTALLVMFHGHLANEEDLMGLVDHLPADLTVASVRAPHAQGPGFTWFPLSQDTGYSVDLVTDSVARVAAWLDSVKSVHPSVSLLGFSMGMAVATTLLRHRPRDFTTVVGLSGFVVPADGSDFFHDDDVAAHPVPLFWGRDQDDPVITGDRIEFTHRWAVAHTSLTKVLYAGIGHSISVRELAHVKEFLELTVFGIEPQPSRG
ncbi:alpha/beta hydrolase [Arthrobacter sp. CAN_C5]|uniref:alpha/beta hydrolase n=1 Tax=Arthrobacter sp. CAN_C5 TaxID=2760706 RepID=UPI001AE13F4D|nr:alpha/beta hydrolase-fold protein [Arthrobacter sp. CAN_C5]MBP2217650.1 phospholipase/carboxylesterase [Arthrobacter sp. CAN_C5]